MLPRLKMRLKTLRAQGQGTENLFLHNLGWLGASELFVRITRLITAIVLARVMDPLLFGLAALVLTVNELIRVFNRNGIGAKIVQCTNSELQAITNTAYRLNFIFCISLFLIQCAVAYPLAKFYAVPELVPMLQVLSLTYLLMPFGMVQASLIQREQRLKTAALIDGGQVGIDNLITTLLALCGLGAWAIVLPKFLTSPIWVFGYRKAYQWKPTGPALSFQLWRDVLKFGRYYLSIELLKTARLNLDNMIIARLLGMEALGLYYFARNAGLGFSLTLINAINSALYPNLCAVKDNVVELKLRFTQNLKRIAMIAIPLISLQAGLAFVYVPIVFGDQWANAIPVLTLLCLSALPRPLAESASALTLATDRINIDFKWNILFTTIFIISVSSAASISLIAVAVSILLIYSISHPIYLAYVWRQVFSLSSQSDHQASQTAATKFNQEKL
jgi:PST family polysaccharide transporter